MVTYVSQYFLACGPGFLSSEDIMETENYYNIDRVSRSQLCYLKNGNYKYYCKYIAKTLNNEDTQSMKFGRAFHKFVLENNKFNDCYFVGDGRSSDAKESVINGLEVISKKDFDIIESMSIALLQNETSRDLLFKSEKEVTFLYDYKGMEFKSLLDGVIEDQNVIFDLKTVSTLKSYDRQMLKFDQTEQVFLYSLAYAKHFKREPRFLHIAIEKTSPFEVKAFDVTDFINIGKDSVNDLIEQYNIVNNMSEDEIIAQQSQIETILSPFAEDL